VFAVPAVLRQRRDRRGAHSSRCEARRVCGAACAHMRGAAMSSPALGRSEIWQRQLEPVPFFHSHASSCHALAARGKPRLAPCSGGAPSGYALVRHRREVTARCHLRFRLRCSGARTARPVAPARPGCSLHERAGVQCVQCAAKQAAVGPFRYSGGAFALHSLLAGRAYATPSFLLPPLLYVQAKNAGCQCHAA